MAGFDAAERQVPFERERGQGSILFDGERLPQAQPEWFDARHWGSHARPVDSGGRGGAWFVDAPFGAVVLRQYLRGGAAASLSRDRYVWHGANRVRSFAEYRLTRVLHARGLPVPRPVAASYLRHGVAYTAAILVERLHDVSSLAERAAIAASDAPWEETGRVVARFHRAGLDHADLNAHNILFDTGGHGWLIDLDRGRMRRPSRRWRERNLARLRRSLLKLRGARPANAVEADFLRLRHAYDATWERGT